MSTPLLLHVMCTAETNAIAAWYWLRPVADNASRRPRVDESIVRGVPGAKSAMHDCFVCRCAEDVNEQLEQGAGLH